MKQQSIYLDYASATPVAEDVFAVMQPYFSVDFYNPSAEYSPARRTKATLEHARQTVAATLGVKPKEVIFTAGCTEANNIAIHGVLQKLPKTNIVVSEIEHHSVLYPAKRYQHQFAPVDKSGIVQAREVLKRINDSTSLVSVQHANNEIGTIQPLRKIAHALEEIRVARRKVGNKTPLYLHTDAAQSANYLQLQAHRLGVDLMSLNGGKIYGPKQSGALFVRSGVELTPLLQGGGQENGLRSGTENVPGVLGFCAALTTAQALKDDEGKRLSGLQKHLAQQLKSAFLALQLNGSMKHRLPNNLNFSLPGYDNERLQMALDQEGIWVATGSACSESDEQPSHVLTAIGCSNREIRGSIRVSMGRATTKSDLDVFVDQLRKVASKSLLAEKH
jgi:cysteine desulfurase